MLLTKSRIYELKLIRFPIEFNLRYFIQHDSRKIVYYFTKDYLPYNMSEEKAGEKFSKFYGDGEHGNRYYFLFGHSAGYVCTKYKRPELYRYFYNNMPNTACIYVEDCVYEAASAGDAKMIDFLMKFHNIDDPNKDLDFIIHTNVDFRNISDYLGSRLSIDDHFYGVMI